MWIREMDERSARKTMEWRYEPPYDLYNDPFSEESLQEKLDGSYRAVLDENGELFGFYCTGESAVIPVGKKLGVYEDAAIDIGLGMCPDMTGKGYGRAFMAAIIEDINTEETLRLSVAVFNERAIKLYEAFGFERAHRFETEKNAFITMLRTSDN
ncbi:GNAT family N-acetyltransferase [Salimicrobium halophilum]|uniref:Ribosomal protein S18 acetylase RimI n=1 Tax=Salimicrobium halophilum TaxID=86666 RepID=A0A1G8QZI3_9BACI|nr:GNAT family N-acetyltransferase [Salimicrobium halophilum]SDJ10136.1 Ribosomal protein S18 acetylase RimI [Salimicrobium halophilum]